jgi:hypothetical protein
MWDCHGKGSIQQKMALFTGKLEVKLKKKPAKCYIWSAALCGAEIGALQKVDQKYSESFEMWCCRRMKKVSWTDRVRNEEVLHRDNDERNILHTVKRGKGDWIGYSWRRNGKIG